MPTLWTRGLVCSCLEEAYRRSPSLPVHTRWSHPPLSTVVEVGISLNWEVRFPFLLADGRDDWRFLRFRAQCRAEKASMLERLGELRWKRSSFETGWRRSADAIAAALNQERINQAALVAGEASEDRLERGGRIAFVPGAPLYVRLGRKAA